MNNTVYRSYQWRSEVFNAYFEVQFPNTPKLELLAVSADLEQNIEEHDILTITFKGKPFKKDTQLAYGDPVKFIYKSGKEVYNFVGKVNRIVQKASLHGVGETVVQCISASSVLKETSQKIYTNVTADQCVARVAAAVGCRAVTQRHPRVRQTIAHTGETYWQFLRSQAKQTGFALRAENTTITFVSKEKITAAKKSQAPYFLYFDSPTDGATTASFRALGTIVYFHPLISDASPETGVKVDRVVTGQDLKGNKAIKATHKNSAPTSSPSAVRPSEDYFL
jgi:hypothetical protein